MFNHLSEHYRASSGTVFELGQEEQAGAALDDRAKHLTEFRLEAGLPVWRYAFGQTVLEKLVFMVHGQNTASICYRLVAGNLGAEVRVFPWVAFRPHDVPLENHVAREYSLTTSGSGCYTISTPDFPSLRLAIHGAQQRFTVDWSTDAALRYREESSRG